MKNDIVNCIYEAKEGRKYVETWRTEDPARVYKDLAQEMISKKINDCKYIRSIKRTTLYNGFQRITVTYDHGGRRIYTVENS